MPITLHITKGKRVRYLLPFTDYELMRLVGHMAQRVGLEGVAIELSLLDDKAMADVNHETMGTRGPTNILSFPLVYDTFAPYIIESDAQAGARDGASRPRGFFPDNAPAKIAVCDEPFEKSCPSERPVSGAVLETTSSFRCPISGGALETVSPPRHRVSNAVRGTNSLFGPVLLGALVISPETVQREARLYGQDLEAYFIFLLAHGFAHLLGYDHGAEMDALMECMKSGALEL